MTVNAKLPKTPQRQSPAAGASDLAVDSLDNKIPIGRARNRTANIYRTLGSNGEQRAKFQGAAVRKATATDGCGCSKSALLVIHTNPICPGRNLIEARAKQFDVLLCGGYWSRRSAPPRTRQISRACGGLSKQNSARPCRKKSLSGLLAMACPNDAFGPSHCASGGSAA
jgi:hypothetical protein